MPIASWILFPATGSFERMLRDLGEVEGCEILPDAARQVAVVVTDTPDATADKELCDRLQSLESVAQAALVFAHAEVDA
jgi:nitrate reductase NapAB chaperone NapD